MIDNFLTWLAWRLPRRLVYWCAIRLFVNATTGEHSDQIVGDLLVLDALKRWQKGEDDGTVRKLQQVRKLWRP